MYLPLLSFQIPRPSLLVVLVVSSSALITFTWYLYMYIYSPCVSPVRCQFVFLSPCRNVPAFVTIVFRCFLRPRLCLIFCLRWLTTRVPNLFPSKECCFAQLSVVSCIWVQTIAVVSLVVIVMRPLRWKQLASHYKRGISDGFAGRSFAELGDPLTSCSESTMLSNDLCMWSIKLLDSGGYKWWGDPLLANEDARQTHNAQWWRI